MSTTRHLINRQRRLAAATPVTAVRVKPRPDEEEPERDVPQAVAGPVLVTEETAADGETRAAARRSLPRGARLPVVLGLLTVLLGGFAAYAGTQASDLRESSATSNVALSDVARTTEVKGQVTNAVNSLFSYNYANTGTADRAARTLLTGKAVQQHKDMLAAVRAQAAKQKLVLTTTVTESGVELIDGNRARVLLYADQSNTNTAAKDDRTTYAAAMFAVDVVRTGGSWRIANIDTFTR
ncbi:nuclear transport factor 2 family protein [Streptomyces beijiangensis]|uniref:Nuclear transport factor 2 family protein n=1 Tax=Streptomyces beijiangensis TaxID=163361 RepID=A0A939F6Y0_9ACTN|nr:nuclear transport factor 2 family protein [Streptomyces beijiangensis]MBO0512723.1 nuclear transport factor 2 family protein [Streptomyces beijiangensis]